MNKKRFDWSFVSIGAIFLVLYGICNITPITSAISKTLSILAPVIGGLCGAFILNIPLSFFESLWIRLFSAKRRVLRRFVCLSLCFLLVIGIVTFFMWIILPEIIETVRDRIIPRIPFYIEELTLWYGHLARWLAEMSVNLPPMNPDSIQNAINNYFRNNFEEIVDHSINIASTVFSGVFDTIIAFVISVYVLAQKEMLGGLVKKLLFAVFPRRTAERTITLAGLTEKTFAKFISGQLIEATILGTLCFIGMLIFGMPFKLVISVLVGITALIPIFGAFIGTGIGAVLILFEDPVKALWFVIFIIVLQQIEGNLIYPKVVGAHVGLPGLWVLIAVTIGSDFGLIGMLVAVPLASLIYATVMQVVNAKLEEKGYRAGIFDEKEQKQERVKRHRPKNKKKDPVVQAEQPTVTEEKKDNEGDQA